MAKKSTCFFFQSQKCIIHKKYCFICVMFTKKIEGMDDVKDYISYVTNKIIHRRSFFISTVSIILSVAAVIISFLRLIVV